MRQKSIHISIRKMRIEDTVKDHKYFIPWLVDVYKQSPPTSCSTDTIKTFQRRAVSYLDLDKLS
jgi:hypothetical protein